MPRLRQILAPAAAGLLLLALAAPVAAADPTPLPPDCAVSSDGSVSCPASTDGASGGGSGSVEGSAGAADGGAVPMLLGTPASCAPDASCEAIPVCEVPDPNVSPDPNATPCPILLDAVPMTTMARGGDAPAASDAPLMAAEAAGAATSGADASATSGSGANGPDYRTLAVLGILGVLVGGGAGLNRRRRQQKG